MKLCKYKSTLVYKDLNYFISFKLLILETIVSQRPWCKLFLFSLFQQTLCKRMITSFMFLWWPTSATAIKKSSWQKRKAHSKREKLMAKEKNSQQKRKAHSKREKLTAKKKSSRQKSKAHGKKEKLMAKKKNLWRKSKTHGKS